MNPVVSILERRYAEHKRTVVSQLFGLTAKHCGAVLHASFPGNNASPMQNGLGEGRFADAAMAEKHGAVNA
jgi:hypothetical protein